MEEWFRKLRKEQIDDRRRYKLLRLRMWATPPTIPEERIRRVIRCRLRACRRHRRMSQVSLARQTGLNPRSIRRMEADEKSPSLLNALAIAAALNTTVDKLWRLTVELVDKVPAVDEV